MSFDTLQEKILSLKNPTVVGLDPKIDYIPKYILDRHIADKGETPDAAAAAFFDYNAGIIDAVCDIVPAVKPQSAFYELLGPPGVAALKKTADYAREKGLYVIGDVKRGDIGSTAEAYSEAYLGRVKIGSTEYVPFGFDAVTVNAYLGSDGVQPFLETSIRMDKALFVLVKTSNPSSAQLQDRETGGRKLYAVVGDLMAMLSKDTLGLHGYSRIGAVVGATYPEELKILREQLSELFFLVPGYGAQGGGAADVAGAFNACGRGAIINSSRGIICAWQKTGCDGRDFGDAARDAALRMRDDLRSVIDIC